MPGWLSPSSSPRYLLAWAVLGVALIGACDGEGSTSEPSSMVIIDGGGNVVTIGAGQPDRTVVATSDETTGFFQPVWSPDGSKLAWGQYRGEEFAVATADPQGDFIAEITTSGLPFYLSWSPDSSRVGLLHQGSPGEIDFVVADVASGESVVADSGTSYYFSWDTDSASVIAHIGMEVFDRVGVDGDSESLGPTDSGYLAPFVTGDGLFHVTGGNLVLGGEPLVGLPGTALFVPNREGTRVAVVTPGVGVTVADEPSLTPGRLVVVDVASGELAPVTTTPIAGFFWNHEGDHLLVLTADRSGQITPLVWEAGGDVTEYPSYRPAESYVQDVLPFFPQYAQSVSYWNREGSAYAFVGMVGEEDGVWIQDLGADEPIHVSDGSWVAWSP